MSVILDTVIQVWTFIKTLPSQVWAIVVGLLISWCGTQAVKFQLDDSLTDKQHKRRVRLWAMVLAFIPAFIIWPKQGLQDYLNALMYAACVGLASPILYILVMFGLYYKFPWLEKKMSARPIVLKKDDGGNVVGWKEGDDKTQYFQITQPKQANTDKTDQPK